MSPLILARLIATGCLTIVCTASLYMTKGEIGIGWFIFGLLIVWSNLEVGSKRCTKCDEKEDEREY